MKLAQTPTATILWTRLTFLLVTCTSSLTTPTSTEGQPLQFSGRAAFEVANDHFVVASATTNTSKVSHNEPRDEQTQPVHDKHVSRRGEHLSTDTRAEQNISLSHEQNAMLQQQRDLHEQHERKRTQNRSGGTHHGTERLGSHDTAMATTHLSKLPAELVERSTSEDIGITPVTNKDPGIMFAILLTTVFGTIAVIAHICSSNNVYAVRDNTDSMVPERRTVVLVHGWMSCSLLTTTQLCYVNLIKLWLRDNLELKLSRGSLSDGTEVACTANMREDVRVVTGTKGIRTLNPGHWFPIRVWDGFVDALCPNYNLLAINYDWRRWGDETYMEEYVSEFRRAIDAAAMSSGAVTVVSHSMGGPVVGYCLSKLGHHWQTRTIAQHIAVAPSFGGTARTGVELATDVPDLSFGCFRFKLASLLLQGSWPSTYTLLPQPRVGSVHIDTGRSFLATPSWTYTRDDAGFAFVQKLNNVFGAERPSLRIPLSTWSSVSKANQDIEDPAIPTHVICGIGVRTVAQATYNNDQFSGKPDLVYEDGDGTMLAQPLRDIVAGWKAAGKPAEIHEFTATDHRSTISAEFTISKVLDLLRNQE